MTWNAEQYLRFGGHRIRPVLDLVGAIDCRAPQRVLDLGCGPGNATMMLRARWPHCDLTGLDNDPVMLARARDDFPAERWLEGDIDAWSHAPGDARPDVVFTNAALQWLPDHASLFPRLIAGVCPGGVFACQMPHNFAAPSHRLLRETMNDARWRDRLGEFARWEPVGESAQYYDWLQPLAVSLDVWETEYLQVLEGADAVLEWVKGSALVPVRELLPASDYAAFTAGYGERLREAYPRRADGTTLLPFRRLFMVVLAK
ncbi:MAG: methyltransferase domain-containing protein [Betaproteobacteria bacterium]